MQLCLRKTENCRIYVKEAGSVILDIFLHFQINNISEAIKLKKYVYYEIKQNKEMNSTYIEKLNFR